MCTKFATSHTLQTRVCNFGWNNTWILFSYACLILALQECMLVVDTMHNLFLGTGKRMIKDTWIGLQMISESKFEVIQARMPVKKTGLICFLL